MKVLAMTALFFSGFALGMSVTNLAYIIVNYKRSAKEFKYPEPPKPQRKNSFAIPSDDDIKAMSKAICNILKDWSM